MIRPLLPAACVLFALSGCTRPDRSEHDEAAAQAPSSARAAEAERSPPSARAAEPEGVEALRELARAALSRRGVSAPSPASVELTIVPALQAIAAAEVASLASPSSTKAASVVVLDPAGGEVLAMAGREGGAEAHDLAARVAYVPGSVMKTFSVAAAVDKGVLREGQTFSGEKGSYKLGAQTMRDGSPHGAMTVGDVLAFSSNVGAAKIFEALGAEGLSQALGRLHFGERPGVELEGASAGEVPPLSSWTKGLGASIASGGTARATSLQVASAFAAVVNGGMYSAPGLVRRVRGAGGEVLFERRASPERALGAEASKAMRVLLQEGVQRDDSTGAKARVAGFRVAGKTGTAGGLDVGGVKAAHASFVGAAPAERPRLVVMVAVDTTEEGYGGGTIAAPAFARVAGKALEALGVGPEGASHEGGGALR